MFDLSICPICRAQLPIEDGRRYVITLQHTPLCPICGAPVLPIPLETTIRPASGERKPRPVVLA